MAYGELYQLKEKLKEPIQVSFVISLGKSKLVLTEARDEGFLDERDEPGLHSIGRSEHVCGE